MNIYQTHVKLPYSYKNTHEFDVYVRCYDYGAWGTLKAVVYKDKLLKDQKLVSNTGTVPRDENNNHIADGWKNDFTPYIWSDETNKQVNVSATRGQDGIKDYPYSVPKGADRQQTVDKETGPNKNSENGDGLTVFEEYRGFMTEQYGGYGGGATGHTRTDPETKDVFCVVHPTLSSYGMGDVSRHSSHSFTELHSICVSTPFGNVQDAEHNFDSSASTTYGWLNSNSTGIADRSYVYAVRVKDGKKHPTKTSSLGFAPISRPFYLSVGNIYIDTIKTFQREQLPGKSISDITKAVIAHEIGHMINLRHCPQGCLDNIKGKCLMFPSATRRDKKGNLVANIDSGPSSHHYIDYDLADPVKSPQTPGKIKTPKKAGKPQTSSPTRTLTPSGGNYTAEAGDSHTANFSTSSAYSSVYWYVKTPSDTTATSQEIDQGDGSLTTADFTYTFPSSVSGDYVFTAYVYDGDNTTVYEESYTVSVSLPSSSTATATSSTTTATTASGTLVADTSSLPANWVFLLSLTSTVPFSSVKWYTFSPGNADESWVGTQNFSPAVSETTYTPYIDNYAGDYNIRAEITPTTGAVFSVSCTVTRE